MIFDLLFRFTGEIGCEAESLCSSFFFDGLSALELGISILMASVDPAAAGEAIFFLAGSCRCVFFNDDGSLLGVGVVHVLIFPSVGLGFGLVLERILAVLDSRMGFFGAA